MDTFYAPLSVHINRIWLYYSCLQLGLDFSCIGANNKEVSVPCQLTSLPPLNRKASISSEVKYKNQKISLIHHHIFIILHISTYIWHSTPSSMQNVSLQASSLGFSGGGPEKEGQLAAMSLEFEYLHGKSWCEMLIGRDDISNYYDVIALGACFHMFFYFCLHLGLSPLGRIQIPET